ncbi:MAG: response regulator [Chloroflexi bacterium]|nr:MAG: response regulator [Chloroflexota bacterium]
MDPQEYVIIVADDDEDDLLLISQVFNSLQRGFPLQTVVNGKELLDYLELLSSPAGWNTRKKPGLVFLDINMPVMNGIETLRQIRDHSHYSCLPVVMLTTVHDQQTIDVCYDIGVVGFLTKPANFDVFTEKINGILNYWFEWVNHPMQ